MRVFGCRHITGNGSSRRRWLRDRLGSRLKSREPLMPDKQRERAHLLQSDRHLVLARANISRQEQLIERLTASGHDTRDAQGFLSAMIETLHSFEHHHRIILDRLAP